MSDIGVAFLTFDFRRGPFAAYLQNVTQKFCVSVGVRVLMSGLTAREEKSSEFKGETIIPFQEHSKVTFSYLFSLTDKAQSEPHPSAVSVIFPLDESGLLYKYAPYLSEELARLAVVIKKDYKFGGKVGSNIQQALDKVIDRQYLERLAQEKPKKADHVEPIAFEKPKTPVDDYSDVLKIIYWILVEEIGPIALRVLRKTLKQAGIAINDTKPNLEVLNPLLIGDLTSSGAFEPTQLDRIQQKLGSVAFHKQTAVDPISEEQSGGGAIGSEQVLSAVPEERSTTSLNPEFVKVRAILMDVMGPLSKRILKKAMGEVNYNPEDQSAEIGNLIQAILDDLKQAGVLAPEQQSTLSERFFKEALGYESI